MSREVVGTQVEQMFGSIAGRYDIANSVLSLGIHHVWRRRLIEMLPPARDKQVLDICTGTADLVPMLKSRFGHAIGLDFCHPMLTNGLDKIAKYGLNGVLLRADALKLPFNDQSFDTITVAFGVRNFEDLASGLNEIQRVLKPGGAALILEFGQPSLPGWRQVYNWYSKYCMPVIGGILTGNRDAYSYLPETAHDFPCGKAFEARLENAGLKPMKTISLTGGIAFAYHAQKQ